MPQSKFTPQQAVELADAFARHRVDYLFIASKRASGRQRDLVDLPLLEEFRREYDRRHAPPIETTLEKALRRSTAKRRRRL